MLPNSFGAFSLIYSLFAFYNNIFNNCHERNLIAYLHPFIHPRPLLSINLCILGFKHGFHQRLPCTAPLSLGEFGNFQVGRLEFFDEWLSSQRLAEIARGVLWLWTCETVNKCVFFLASQRKDLQIFSTASSSNVRTSSQKSPIFKGTTVFTAWYLWGNDC